MSLPEKRPLIRPDGMRSLGLGWAVTGVLRPWIFGRNQNSVPILLAVIGLVLLLYSMASVGPVVVDRTAVLGLVNYLPRAYWLGLVLVVASSVLVFLRLEHARDGISVVLLVVMGLYVMGLPVFVEENGRGPETYYPTSEVKTLLANHRIDPTKPYSLLSYRSWPGIHFLSATLLLVPGVPVGFTKYVPLLWTPFFILLTLSLGKRLGARGDRWFLLGFVSLSSWFLHTEYSPQGIAILLFILLLVLLSGPDDRGKDRGLATLVFVAILILHSMTALAALAIMLARSVYRRKPLEAGVFFTVFAAWYLYSATFAMHVGVRQFWRLPFQGIRVVAEFAKYQTPGTVGRTVARSFQLGFLATYLAYGVASLILLLGRIRKRQPIGHLGVPLSWIAGSSLILATGFGESVSRLYLYALVPAVAVIALALPSNKIGRIALAALMVLTSGLILPSRYGGEVTWAQVRTTELRGAEFFAQRVRPRETYFYAYSEFLIQSFEPSVVLTDSINPMWLFADTGKIDPSLPDRARYVLLTQQGSDYLLFTWGHDPYRGWPQTEQGLRSRLLYDNGYFATYENR